MRDQAIKMHFAGASGHRVGKVMGMSKTNVYNWVKKPQPMWINDLTLKDFFEIDERYHFINMGWHTENTGKHVYNTLNKPDAASNS